MILSMIALKQLIHMEDIHLIKPLSTFPKQIGEWVGKESRFDQEIYDVLGVDDSFLCNYRGPEGRLVQLYIGFYQSQREGDLIHSPKHCMPGAGWNIIRTSLEEVEIPGSNPGTMKTVKLVLQKGPQKQIVLYWFHSRGRIITSEYWQKIYMVIDSIKKHRTDGSFVRLIAPVINGNETETLKNLKKFTMLILPVLNEHIPS
jgi:EpsI family protein